MGCYRSCVVLPHCGACYRTCGHCMRMRMRCATHCGAATAAVVVLRTVGCYRSCVVLRTVAATAAGCATHCGLLPQLVWCCRTLGVLPHALCVLAHTWRSAATAAPLSCSRSRSLLCSSQPRPNGLWAERSRAESESREQDPNPPLRCAEPDAWPLWWCVVLALTGRARVNRIH